jgi:tetraacyldisaccharide 4'-kinase
LLRYLLFPFSLLYGLIIRLRHWLFDIGLLKSVTPKANYIVIGNLSMGGTGKSPFTRWLAEKLLPGYRIAILSRGYGRTTRGFRIVQSSDTAELCGDEPLEFRMSLPPQVTVAVCENRVQGIEELLKLPHPPELILLDDALQHRRLSGGFRILLTTWKRPYYKDFLFPVGYLRDEKKAAKRAHALVFSKCPELANEEMVEVAKRSGFDGPVSFCKLKYGEIQGKSAVQTSDTFMAITGIAHPEEFIAEAGRRVKIAEIRKFADHHTFSTAELQSMAAACKERQWSIITTQKDLMRLTPHLRQELDGINVTFLPVSPDFIAGESELLSQIRNYLHA